MKILHTADWHLGKLIHGIYMTEDQAHMLDQLIAYIEAESPNLIIIAGDIYDRAIPPVEAIALFDQFLNRVALELEIPIIAISGNHDSPRRLGFGSAFLQNRNCHLITELSQAFSPIHFQDQYGDVNIYTIPYVEPAEVRAYFKDPTILSHDDAFKALMQEISTNLDPKARNILVLHAFVIHSSTPEKLTSDSERPLSIGGSEYISADYFENFDYVAPGHLHQAHSIKNDAIHYSGSLLKYSLSEAHHKKCVLEVELHEKTAPIAVEKVNFTPKRDLREVKGTIKELLLQPKSEDFIFVTLLDETPVLQPMEQLRTVFPNVMHIRRDLQKTRTLKEDQNRLKEIAKTDDLSLFKGFYEALTERDPDPETLKIFRESLSSMLDTEQ